jgi:uncharacterized RDD family membrane protein YckC
MAIIHMTKMDGTLKIDTPENVSFDYNVAGIGSRFLAALVDTTLVFFLQAILLAIVILGIGLGVDQFTGNFTGWIIAILGMISFLFLWGYYIFFEILWNGQSPGKRLVGIRVIRIDGTPITASESIIRNLVRIIDLLPTAYGVGVVTMFINVNSRRVGDLAAGTVVVHDRQTKGLHELSPVQPATLDTSGSQEYLPDSFPLEKVTEHDLHIIEEFLSRRGELSNHTRLAGHLLESMIARLGISSESITPGRSEEILEAIYKIKHGKQEG